MIEEMNLEDAIRITKNRKSGPTGYTAMCEAAETLVAEVKRLNGEQRSAKLLVAQLQARVFELESKHERKPIAATDAPGNEGIEGVLASLSQGFAAAHDDLTADICRNAANEIKRLRDELAGRASEVGRLNVVLRDAQADIEQLQSHADAIRRDVSTLHVRQCHNCNKVHWHADDRMSYALCPECGSQDTRKVKG